LSTSMYSAIFPGATFTVVCIITFITAPPFF
jgi:hypothetical protein